MDFLNKKYKMESSENFDEFLQAIGMSLLNRKMVGGIKPTYELKKVGDSYVFATYTAIKNIELKFKCGEEFEETRADGVKVKSVITLEGNTMKHIQKTPDGTEVVIIREFSADQLKVTSTAKGVTSVRIFRPE